VKKDGLLVVIPILLLSTLVVPALCDDLTVGVSVGDWFKYEGTLDYWEADDVVPFPPDQYTTFLQTYNESNWMTYTVTGIEGNVITFEVLTHWKNGTETIETTTDDITSSFTMMAIGANLEPGTQIRDEYDWQYFIWPPRYLNNSIIVEYESGPRETNVLDWLHPIGYTNQIYHWDKATGVQVLYEVHANNTDYTSGGEYKYIATFKLIDTNVDELKIPEYSTGTVMVLTLVAVTASLEIYRRKKVQR
jgi:hypothetical protein